MVITSWNSDWPGVAIPLDVEVFTWGRSAAQGPRTAPAREGPATRPDASCTSMRTPSLASVAIRYQ